MRQRKIKDIDNKLAAYGAFTVPIPAANKGKWQEIFGNHNPIYLDGEFGGFAIHIMQK